MIGYIYKIYNDNLTYYGSTTKKLNQRLNGHKYDCKKSPSLSVNKIISTGDYKIEKIEEVIFENRKELRERERFYIINFECVNNQTPNITRKESQEKYRLKNLPKIKKYYQEVLKERRKTEFKECLICNKKITSNNFASHKKTKTHLKNLSK